ncbi:acyl-CoA thioesterase [Burkholderia plantarii]|jgi:acyl-CoA thioester hydrolase|uniref:Thioesterase superfamily protein n=1 Tax=Burkholderia plantarii TaxID=41899 RepID=A0A0B6RT87_BURPL|nr:thioesterase family protein [Burkholderia plantarii]AJK45334.1 thioesterase superfamily protein [Burkholderia plantarii]ALK29606.1 thioesterase superfamily protein [Burkholderia plantarii]WLE58314.1 acyl-CoA thioesterase [Burkholderia plantarii]GLZ20093.1 thioesterase [Burkholderia plantarii]
MSKRHYETPIVVKYRDTDSMGHVSSPVYYDYLQHSYLSYMFDLLDLPKSEKLPHIMVKTQCEYVTPALFGDKLTVKSSVIKFGTKSFEIEHLMERDDKTIVARGLSTHVMFDYETNKTTPVPEEFKQKIIGYQGEV